MTETIRNHDIGTDFIVRIVEDDVVVNLTTATVLKIRFRKPSGEILEKDATKVTDGSDGKIHYVGVEGDIDEEGAWLMQGYAYIGTWIGSTETGTFSVGKALTLPDLPT